MSEINLSEDQDHLLRPRRVPGAQGGRAPQHLLPLQRLHGSVAGWDGCGYSRWVSSFKQNTSTNYVMHGEGGGGHFKQNLKTLIFFRLFFFFNIISTDCILSLKSVTSGFTLHKIPLQSPHVLDKNINIVVFLMIFDDVFMSWRKVSTIFMDIC